MFKTLEKENPEEDNVKQKSVDWSDVYKKALEAMNKKKQKRDYSFMHYGYDEMKIWVKEIRNILIYFLSF